jgi:molybdate transport system permease protein
MIPDFLTVITISFKISIVATLINLPMAVGIAYILTRFRFPGKGFVDSIINLPLVLPPVVTGWLLLLLLGTQGFVGEPLFRILGLRIAFTQGAAVLASMIVSFPLILRSIRISLELVDPRLEKTAASLGAAPLAVFFRVTLPLSAPGIVTGFVMGFARCLGEFGATITFAGNIAGETRTVPLAVYSFLQVSGKEGDAALLVLFSIAVSLGAMFISSRLEKSMKYGEGHVS